MSKYADIEQIKEVIRTEWVKYMPMDLDVNLSFVLGKIAEVPTIEVSEDCISREWLIKALDNLDWYDFDMFYKVVENAPSAVPTQSNANQCVESVGRAEGEWENYKDEHRCSECGEVVIGDWYDDEWYDYCPNCGAKMCLE